MYFVMTDDVSSKAFQINGHIETIKEPQFAEHFWTANRGGVIFSFVKLLQTLANEGAFF